jgi:predicted O-methyltransferase YrrM
MIHKSRETFGALFQSVNEKGIGAEIGVQQGFNAKRILDSGWEGSLVCVDNWVRPKELFEAKQRLSHFRTSFIQGDSAKSAELFANESLDFVYIDAGHDYEEVKLDFLAWFPKVRVGGIVSGHDYAPASHKNDCDGVRVFIEEYMAANPEVEMNFTTDDFYYGEDKNIYGNEYQSWWFIKTDSKLKEQSERV